MAGPLFVVQPTLVVVAVPILMVLSFLSFCAGAPVRGAEDPSGTRPPSPPLQRE